MIVDFIEVIVETVFYLVFARGFEPVWHHADHEQTKRRRLQRWYILRQNSGKVIQRPVSI